MCVRLRTLSEDGEECTLRGRKHGGEPRAQEVSLPPCSPSFGVAGLHVAFLCGSVRDEPAGFRVSFVSVCSLSPQCS